MRQAAYVNECIHCNVLAPRTCKRYSDRYPVAGKLTPYFVSQPSRQCAGPTPGISRNGGVRRSGSNGPGVPTVTKHLKAEAASVAPGRPSHSHPPWAAAPLAVCLAAPLGGGGAGDLLQKPRCKCRRRFCFDDDGVVRFSNAAYVFMDWAAGDGGIYILGALPVVCGLRHDYIDSLLKPIN